MVQLGDRNNNGEVTTCHLHDLMRDKGLEIVKEENFLQIVEDQSGFNLRQLAFEDASSAKGTRHLTIYVGDWVDIMFEVALWGKSSNLRSLVFFPVGQQLGLQVGNEWMILVCEEFPLLRVFDFEGLHLTGSLPSEIGDLICLRYLSLKGTEISELPSSIGNLKSLLILDLRVKDSIIVPNVLSRLKSLKHLYLPTRHISRNVTNDQPYKIEENAKLILDNMGSLEKIEGLNLDNLENLGLEKLTSLRKVSASCASNRETLEPFLRSQTIKRLNLALDANLIRNDPTMLSTCSALQVLYLDEAVHTTLPIRPNMYPRSLVQLDISYCILEEDPMKVLETLPKLKSLAFHICYQGTEMACISSEGFPELTYLAFDTIHSLRKWTVVKGSLPKLKRIHIGGTPIARLPNVLPRQLSVACSPCVDGIRRYGGCCWGTE